MTDPNWRGSTTRRAIQGQRREWGTSLEHDPFAGLCEKRPVRVLAGLRYELRKGSDIALPWSQFLQSAGRRADKPKLAGLIARRLVALPHSAFAPIIMPASYAQRSLPNARMRRARHRKA